MVHSADRVIALKLHSLHEEDRAWVMSQLDSSKRQVLQLLLDELQELKLKVDAPLLESIKKQTKPSTTTSSNNNNHIQRIDAASSLQIKEIFEEEPKFLFNCLAAQHKWQWLSEFNKRFKTEIPNVAPYKNKHKNITPNAKQALFKVVENKLGTVAQFSAPETYAERGITHASKQVLQKILNRVLLWKQ